LATDCTIAAQSTGAVSAVFAAQSTGAVSAVFAAQSTVAVLLSLKRSLNHYERLRLKF
jgi:hypothetical protein